MSESIPGTIGKYQIIREIARSNDIVYEAYDPRMNRRVAVKELAMPKGATQQQREDRLKRFEREARAAGSLVHPNIVTIYEVGTDGDKNYIAMEFLTGRNLRKEIDKTGFIEPQKAVEVAIEILEGLSFAHENGVIHRDIKPDNVQLLDDGQIKLTDFGIARLTFEPNITMDGQVFGTPSYMSPEQINGQEIDARSDLFGVGVLLYEMVSGQKPFQGDSVVSITYAIMNKRPDQPAQASYPLWQVIERALEKTPDARHRSAGEMIDALKHVLKGFSSGVFEPPLPQFHPGQVVAGPPPVYNPYLTPQAPPAIHTPYGTPMPGQPGGGNPPTGGMYQPYVPGQLPQAYPPPTGQVPVYYPPPPRQPWIKPEHKQGIANFFIAVLLIGAVIGFVILILNALANTPPAQPASGSSEPTIQEDVVASNDTATRPVERPQPRTEESRSNSVVPPVREEPTVNTAAAFIEAEQQVETASGVDSPGLRLQMYSEADLLFSEAISSASTAYERDQLSLRAASKYVSVANQLQQRGQQDRAREAFRRAKGFAQVDPELMSEIDRAIEQLGG